MPELSGDREVRAVNGALMTGLVAMPAIFVWFLLFPGYAASLRKVVFIYAFGPAAVVFIATLVEEITRA